ncbi:hypothetical protein HOLleu_05456 [Holothuria leucospilota]|uniref:Uncharacterized protein n=1 Tax=Holothuria leucospilota TaxID=206669 RepID=A0A9Q1HEJ1_HOLLE|nr:hypothetical protein HOLleu_05456 [Holothuria leucospilota]
MEQPCQVCRTWSSREWELLRQRSEERGKSIAKKKGSKGSKSSSKSSRASSHKSSSHESRHSKKKSVPGTPVQNPTDKANEIGTGAALAGHPSLASKIGCSAAITAGSPSLPENNEIGSSAVNPGLPHLQENTQPEAGVDVSSLGLPSLFPGNPATSVSGTVTQQAANPENQGFSGDNPMDISFSSSLHSTVPQDFEGFQDRGRSKHRSSSKSKKKKRRRRHSSSSSSSSSPSSCGRKRRHSPHTDFPTEALSRLVTLLSQSADRLATPSQPAQDQPSTSITQPPSDPILLPEHRPDSPSEVESVATGDFQFHVARSHSRSRSRSHSMDASEDSDDEPIMGTSFFKESFEKAVEVVRRQLGFDSPPVPDPPVAKRSKLSLNKPAGPRKPVMPVDTECFDRFESQANSRVWRAFPKRQSSDFHISDEDFSSFFSSPAIPDSCLDKLKSAGAVDSRGHFRSPMTKKSFTSLHGMDLAARTGMKFASSLLLFAEVLSKAFRQSGSDEVSRKDIGAIVNMLGPIARLSYDQFAKVAVRASTDRRELVLDNIHWLSKDIKRRFMKLPLSGPDLFGGKFDEQLTTEIKRKKDINKADFTFKKPPPSKPRRSPSRAFSGRQARPSVFSSRRPSMPQQQRGRPRSQSSSRGFSNSSSNQFSSRRSLRGSDRSSFRGSGRFQTRP